MVEYQIGIRSRRDKWGMYLEKATFGVAVLFFVFVFFSKAAMNSLGGLVLLLSLLSIVVNKQKIFRDNTWLVLIVVPVVVGGGAALFSESGGLLAVAGFLNRMKFVFLFFVLAAVVKDEERLWWLLGAVLLSGVSASLLGLAHPGQRVYGSFSGMHHIGRNADMLMISFLGIICFLGDSVFRRRIGTLGVGLLTCVATLFFWGIVMSAMRGTWLGFLVGIGVYSLLFNRKFLIVGGVLVVLALSMGPSGTVVKEFKSIGNTTSDSSNLARLQLWQAGLDFSKNHLLLGSGRDRITEQFTAFYYAQPEEYQRKYKRSIQFPGHFHNSYIQLFVEGGLLFFLVFVVCGTLLMYRLVRSLTADSFGEKVYVQAAIVASSGFIFAQFFHSELYSYGSALLVLVFFAGLAATRWREDENTPNQIANSYR